MGVNVQASAQWCCPDCQAQNTVEWARCWRCDRWHDTEPAGWNPAWLALLTVATALGLVLKRTIRRWV